MPKPTKLPRARVIPAVAVRGILIDHVKADMDTHYVCAPMPSLKSARQRAKFENLSEGEKVDKIAELCAIEIATAFVRGQLDSNVVTDKREDYKLAREILALMEARTL